MIFGTRWHLKELILLSFLQIAWASDSTLVPVDSPPSLKYSAFGGSLGLFGSFSSLSVLSYVNESSFLVASNSTDSSDKSLFLRQLSSTGDLNLKLADFNGQVTQLEALTNDSVILNGNFTTFNSQNVSGPLIYNLSDQNITALLPSSVNGSVNTFFVDNNLVYLGGDFTFNSTYGAAIYDLSSNTLKSTPFLGFGQNSVVNAITKISDDKDSVTDGSIIFGGSFDTLGFKELLTHNSSVANNTQTNSTNSSLITAEQIISLKSGIFTNVNSDGSTSDSALICPSSGDLNWKLTASEGGQWAVELPDEMKGLAPTKARIYIPSGSDGTKTFRIYSYPNNGIMNLSYIDPATSTIAYCDAWCPLSTLDELTNYTQANIKSIENQNETEAQLSNNVTFIDDNGSFSSYYDADTKTKTLGYGSNYQEFAFENSIQIDKVGLTIVDWYGSHGALAGFQLYSNAITVYGNATLNLPNCDSDEVDNGLNNFSDIQNGTFESVTSLNSAVSGVNYLVSNDTDAQITLYPNISYSGVYSFIIDTPGCIADDSCDKRPIVNVTVISDSNEVLATKLIYQNNDYDKFDYLYYGHLNGTYDSEENYVSDSDHNGENRVVISYAEAITEGQETFMVVDKIVATIVSLDNYYDKNSTNHTTKSSSGGLSYISLNGLFEYSLNNFTNFDASLVSTLINNKTVISPNNTFVGNSTLNLISGQLSKNTSIDELLLINDDSRLLLRGNVYSNSTNLTLANSNLITFDLGTYNTTANETVGSITSLAKRSESTTFDLNGAVFNDSISSLFPIPSGVLFIGQFQISKNTSMTFSDLSNGNSSVDSISNFALFSNDKQWFGFGNKFADVAYDQFTNITISDVEYFVFSSSLSNDDYEVWDNTNSAWITNSNYQLKINNAVELNSKQSILSGGSFNIMDFYTLNQVGIYGESNFTSYNFTTNNSDSSISQSYYVNSSLSVIAGDFETTKSVSKIGLISNNSTIAGLSGNLKWSNDSTVQSLYVDSNSEYLFVGFNGTVSINDSDVVSGVLIYNLQNNSLSSFQPAQLSNDAGPVNVNSIVLYDKSSKLLVGGDFDSAGSLGCSAMCVYDMVNTRWISPQSVSSSSTNTVSFDGVVTGIRFYQSNEVLISGDLTLSNSSVNFLTYNFDNGNIGTNSALNTLGSSKSINKYIVNDQDNQDLGGRLVALGDNFISAFNGSGWNSIDSEIVYDSSTKLNDVKLLELASSNSNNTGAYFDKSMTLVLAGKFALKDYGSMNLAFFNGTNWIPYVYTSTDESSLGEIRSILIKDAFRFTSSDEVSESSKFLSKGKVVGISLACALGSTTLLGLLYIIPYFALFRKSYDESERNNQRIHENEMLGAVNPEDLLHEIDLQRNT